ncbi:MAG: thioredoxin [Candidatus Eremiobacteraeota bacterium]|nr:thioredoxin [Candidatus Eremiobacteraeota bacterium]
MTYPEPAVAELIDRLTIPFQIDNTVDANAGLLEKVRHVWTPDLRVLESDGNELYRWNGYLPPEEFAAQLLVAAGQARLRRKEFGPARELFEEALRRFPTAFVAPEAQYFVAVTRYRATGESSELLKGWHRLETRYPQTEWVAKQDFH